MHDAGLRAKAAETEAKVLGSTVAEQRSQLSACQGERRALEVKAVELASQLQALEKQLGQERREAGDRLRQTGAAAEESAREWAARLREVEATAEEARAQLAQVVRS